MLLELLLRKKQKVAEILTDFFEDNYNGSAFWHSFFWFICKKKLTTGVIYERTINTTI